MNGWNRTHFSVWLLLLTLSAGATETSRYIFFNIAPDSAWNQNRPESFTRELFDQVRNSIQPAENPRLRIGLSFVFSTLESPAPVLEKSLRNLLASSEDANLPVLLAFDGQNWWQNRPDLWNWWDPKAPGYNPSNVFNVEWTGWTPDTAVKIGWRNWGRQHRVAPAPNLASPAVVSAHVQALRPLLRATKAWYQQLPPARKWLFGGVKLGWEAGIGYNAYYYTNGNRLVERWPHDASHDPKVGLELTLGLSGGACQLGFAAVQSAGIKSSGQLTRDDLGKVVARYLEALCLEAHKAGLPPALVYTHQGGTYAPWEKHLPFWPAWNQWATPGWSFYQIDPARAGALSDELSKAGRTRWAACEWWWGGATAADWEDHFRRTIAFKDCRFICVYNWNLGMFEKQTAGQKAVREVVKSW